MTASCYKVLHAFDPICMALFLDSQFIEDRGRASCPFEETPSLPLPTRDFACL